MTAFLDTNVLVYKLDREAPGKRLRATELVNELFAAGEAMLSTQVLQEFYNTATHKFGLPPEGAADAARLYAKARLIQVTNDIIFAAMTRHASAQFSFWDALIVEAALAGGAQLLYTEDMQDGLTVDGLTIRNPFLPA